MQDKKAFSLLQKTEKEKATAKERAAWLLNSITSGTKKMTPLPF